MIELHQYFLSLFGLNIGELWDLKALSEQCAKLKRYTFLLTSMPLHVKGSIGSPPNAMAVSIPQNAFRLSKLLDHILKTIVSNNSPCQTSCRCIFLHRQFDSVIANFSTLSPYTDLLSDAFLRTNPVNALP